MRLYSQPRNSPTGVNNELIESNQDTNRWNRRDRWIERVPAPLPAPVRQHRAIDADDAHVAVGDADADDAGRLPGAVAARPAPHRLHSRQLFVHFSALFTGFYRVSPRRIPTRISSESRLFRLVDIETTLKVQYWKNIQSLFALWAIP